MDDKLKELLLQNEQKIRNLISRNGSGSQEYNELVFEQINRSILLLEVENQEFIDLYNKNFDLLNCDGFNLVVTQEEGSPFSSYAKELKGEISSKGYLLLSTIKTNFNFSGMESGHYAKQYGGIINGLGRVQVKATKIGYVFFGGRLPQKYEGKIDLDGNININTTKTIWESGGSYFVGNILGDPFNRNEISRKRFLENRQRLNQIILDFRNNL